MHTGVEQVRGCLARALLAGACLAPSGCVVGKIDRNLQSVNDRMETVNAGLDRVREELEEVNKHLAQSNEHLAQSNDRLERVEGQLAQMDEIGRSLRGLDVHLASIRATIENLDEVIPLIEFAEPAEGRPREQEPGDGND